MSTSAIPLSLPGEPDRYSAARGEVRRVLIAAVAILALAALVSPWDMSIARFCRDRIGAGEIGSFLENVEPFGHAAGVALIVVTVAAMDSRNKDFLRRLIVGTSSAGIAAALLKRLVVRVRPRHLPLVEESAWSTFRNWDHFSWSDAARQSFPSGHAAMAVALACVLSNAYPRARWWFFTLATLSSVQRIQNSAHFPSDVLAGAALGWLCGGLAISLGSRHAPATSR